MNYWENPIELLWKLQKIVSTWKRKQVIEKNIEQALQNMEQFLEDWAKREDIETSIDDSMKHIANSYGLRSQRLEDCMTDLTALYAVVKHQWIKKS